MNNIYKVIWSKAKNCYVVASEIARSHTKSASGSEKIGGVTRRSLLASLMALSLLCGGLGVAEAAVVHVNEVAGGTSAVYTTDETYTKTEADAKYAKATDVTANTTNIGTNKAAIEDLKDNKLDKTLASATFATKDALNNLTATVNDKADEAAVTTALDGKADKATTLAGYGITDAYTKGDVDDKLNAKADAANVFTKDQTYTRDQVNTKLADYAKSADVYTKTDADAKFATSGALTTAKTELDQKIDNEIANRITSDTALDQKIDNEIANRITSDTALDQKIDNEIANRITSDTALDQKIDKEIQDRKNAIKDTNDRTGGIARNTEKTQTTIEGIVKVDNQGNVKDVKGLAAETITTSGNADLKGNVILGTNTANTVTVNGNADFNEAVNMDKGLTVTSGDTTLKGTKVDGKLTVTDETDLKNTKVDGTLTTTGKATFQEAVEMDKGLTVTGDTKLKATTVDGKLTAGDADLKDTKVDGKLGVTGDTTLDGALTAKGEAKFEKNVTVEKDLTVNGKLNVGEIYLENNKLEATGKKHDSATSITADGISNLAKVTEHGHTTESQFTHNEKGTINYAKDGDSTDWTETRSDVTADGVKTEAKDSKGNRTNTSQTASENKTYLEDKDSKNTNSTIDTAKGYDKTIKGENGQTSTKQDELNITNTAADGTITNDAKNIVNNATGDMTNTVGGKLTTTVTGATEENYNGGLTTKVTGEEKHTVTGKQTNTVEGGQENIISGGQTNTITGGQVNNITGDQTTTITGNKKETVTENVTEDYQKNLTTTVGGNEIHDVKGTKTETVEGKVTENFKGGQETNVTGNQDIHVTGKQTNKIDGDQENTIGGNQTTTVTGDISNKAKNITNEASNSITDKVGDHTRVLDSDGITDTVGGSTFKQRIDKIMMESKNVSIKAEETLTNEAKVITNRASEVINNEAVNINNKATGIITSKASEIKNQADKLISNKVGENTWENMENGKITTSIKDGAKQNLTQSDAAGTTQSTVDGGKSTVTIQNADGLTDAVTDGRNTSVQNQTASQIAAAVKDGAGNENASVANATTSANTITNGTKANTVISTADGTRFINSEANTAFEGGTYTDTTIKGNTITTGKVTMDYADVMKDLGVHGSATVDNDLTVKGITNTKTLNVTEDASVGRNLSVGGNATITGDVTANSYKVGDKTYISADGINANNQKITNVADGSISEGSKDAVNGGQLYGVKRDLEHQVDKVGANAAAMANLRPMEFDPSSKWNIAAAIGNYGSETAAALGAFYRPNDNVMVNLSTAFGTGENMVGGGVSVRLGKGGNKLSREETNALKAQVADLTARMDALLSVLNPNMSKDFPDVPENHWAYEAVSRLAGNDIVQGYPDGEFHGERTMTRYEMAEIIYNALSRGAEAERKLVEEFKPELQAMAASKKSTAEKAEG